MENTAGCSTARTARESEASHLIFGSAEFWGVDAFESIEEEKACEPTQQKVLAKTKIELQPPRQEVSEDMEGTVGFSASRAARENEASHLIFGCAELGRFDVP